jgi:hypothetical protein
MKLRFRLSRRFIYPVILFILIVILIVLQFNSQAVVPFQNALAQNADDWQTYDDTDSRLLYENGTWEMFNVSAAVGGTLTGTIDPGATLTAYFEGTGIRVIYSLGPEGGDFTGLVNQEWVQYRSSYAESYSHGYSVSFEELTFGHHRLLVENGDGAIWIEAIEVQGTLLDFSTLPTVTPTPGRQIANPESMRVQSLEGEGFYLGAESKSVTVSSTTGGGWFYDSIEWPGLNASVNPIIGTCYTAELQGMTGIQYAEMRMGHDGYASPWIGFWEDTSGVSPVVYSTCGAENFTPPGGTRFSKAQICAQVCPGAARVMGPGDWPKRVDGDYVGTWKIGYQKAGALYITDMRLIYYGIAPEPTSTPTPTETPTETPSPIPTCDPNALNLYQSAQSNGLLESEECIVPTIPPTNTPRPTYTPSPTFTPTPTCPWYGTPESDEESCQYEYQGNLAVSYADAYKTTVNPNFCGFNYGGVDCDGDNNGTDCTNFVSQALHFGGLPMTSDWNCQLQSTMGQLICSNYPANWAGATLLPDYLTTTIGGINTGTDISIVPYNAAYGINVFSDGTTIILPDEVFTATEQQFDEVQKGDLLYTTNSIEHIAMVTGWGPYFTTWDQLAQFSAGGAVGYWCENGMRSTNERPGTPVADPNEVAECSAGNLSSTRTICCTIPYVIDHGANYSSGYEYAAGPKPYYALYWAPPPNGDLGSGAASGDWGFIQIPRSIISIPSLMLLDPTTFETREEMDPGYVP